MSFTNKRFTNRVPLANNYTLPNQKLKEKEAVSKISQGKSENVTKNDEDFWSDCIEKKSDEEVLKNEKSSIKEKVSNQSSAADRFKDSKSSTERRKKSQEEYLTFNDDKLNQEVSIESKRTDRNNNMHNGVYKKVAPLKIEIRHVKSLNEENKEGINPSSSETINILNQSINLKEKTPSRNVNKTLYENFSQNSKMTREERFQKFLTKFSNSTINDLNDGSKQRNTVRSIQAQERCYLLHEKGKIKNEVNSLIFQKNNEMKLMKEMSECTFKPRTNSVEYLKSTKDFTNNDYIKRQDEMKTFYDRSVMWKKLKDENLDRTRSIKIRTEAPSFKPKITHANPEIYAHKKNPVSEYVLKNYVNRLQKARKEENFRKFVKEKGYRPSNPNLHNSSMRMKSQENMSWYQEETQGNLGKAIGILHRSLHSFDFNDDYNIDT